MKKITLLATLLLITITQNLFAQLDCSSAIEDANQSIYPMPVVGTVAPAGPDYGSLDILTRPFWGTLAACDTGYIETYHTVTPADINSFYGIIIWGPFHSKTEACNNLNASNIFMIRDSIPTLASPGNFGSPTFNVSSGDLYIYMVTTNDIMPNSNITNFLYAGIHFGNHKPCFVCNGEVSQMYYRTVCLITFDSTSQKTRLIWEKESPDKGVAGYIIYRTAAQGGIMDSVGYIPESLPSDFIDYDSHPLQYAEYYRVVPVDSCGDQHDLYEYLTNTAGFLQTYPSGNNTVNLNWNQFGVSNYQNNFESVLYIHRGTSPQNMPIIDTIPVGVLNYTDITAPPGQQYYAVEHRRTSPCDPLRLASGSNPYVSSMTNPSVATVTGLQVIQNENMVSVNPVPAVDQLNIVVDNTLIGNKITLVDVNGKIWNSDLIRSTSETIDVSELAAGNYWLCISGKEKIVKKIMIGK